LGYQLLKGIVYATDLLHQIAQTNQAQLGKIIEGLWRGFNVREISKKSGEYIVRLNTR